MPLTTLKEQDLLELLYQNKSGILTADPKILDGYSKSCQELGIRELFHIEEQPKTVENALEKWNMPEEYHNIDLAEYFAHLVSSPDEIERVIIELELFEKNGLNTMLKFMIYIVDVMKQNNIVWGVGRGSSVSSYLLFLVGLHSVNPIKYNLDIKEFFR